jgi:C4-type Zn-finger protein
MGIIIYGTSKSIIGMDENFRYCPSCEANSMADLMVSSIYSHFYFIPIFPVTKEADIICQKCGLRSYGIAFNAKTINNYEEVKSKFRHPWYTYAFVTFISLLIILAIIF